MTRSMTRSRRRTICLRRAPLRARAQAWPCASVDGDGDVLAHYSLAFSFTPPRSEEPQERPEQGGEQQRRRSSTGSPRILVVDDEDTIRLLCRVNLGLAGMDTLEAADGRAAVAVARAERPDLILLDVMMPHLDGWQVAAELARSAETRDIPIIFLSARTDPADHERGYEAGGVGYVTKPFDPVGLSDTVREVLARVERGERDQLRQERLRRLRRTGDG